MGEEDDLGFALTLTSWCSSLRDSVIRSLARAGTSGGTTGARVGVSIGGGAPSISINMLITTMKTSTILTPRIPPSRHSWAALRDHKRAN